MINKINYNGYQIFNTGKDRYEIKSYVYPFTSLKFKSLKQAKVWCNIKNG